MANPLYSSLRDSTVSPLLAQYGFACSIASQSGEVFNPATGEMTSAGSETLHKTFGVFGNVLKFEREGTKVNAVELFVEAKLLKFEPTSSMRVKIDGKYYDILKVKPVNPGGVAVLYQLTIQK